MRQRQFIEALGLLDVLFDPVAELRIFLVSLLQPRSQIASRFFQIPTVVDPTQLLQAVVVGLARRFLMAGKLKAGSPAKPVARLGLHFTLKNSASITTKPKTRFSIAPREQPSQYGRSRRLSIFSGFVLGAGVKGIDLMRSSDQQ